MSPFWEPSVDVSMRRRDEGWVEAGVAENASSRPYLGHPLARRQILILAFLISVGFLGLFGRVLQLQVLQGAYHRGLAEGNRLRTTVISAPRGLFYDHYGQVLTENVPRVSLALIPYDLPKKEEDRQRLFAEVATTSGIEQALIQQTWDAIPQNRRVGFEPVLVDVALSPSQGIRLQLAAGQWPGVSVITAPERRVVTNEVVNTSLSHVIGYVGRVSEADLDAPGGTYTTTDIIGKNGLELTYESLLKGVNGNREVEVNALGEDQKTYFETTPTPGNHLWLTLDKELQMVAEKALRTSLTRVGATRGALVVMNPQTGGVMAFVSLPAFDANQFNQGIGHEAYQALANDADHPLFNRVVQGLYPSGSTIKIIFAAGALSEGIVTTSTTFLSEGGIRVGQWFFPDWKGGGHGVTNVRKAIAESVNTFFYIVGGGYQGTRGLGLEGLGRWAANFGLGSKTGIDLPNEQSGFFPTEQWKEETKKEQWYIGDTYHVAIGQGDVLVTPLQVANYTSAFANGGTLYKPHFLSEVVAADGTKRTKIEPVVLKSNMASAEVIKVVQEGMRQTITAGSAQYLGDLPIPVAGKTGTAEPGGDNKTHAWFTGYGPYDAPQIQITALVENSGDGSTSAALAAKEVFKWWADNRYEK